MTVEALVANIKAVIINPLIGLLFAVALIVFLWGIVQFLWNANNDEDRNAGKRHMLWGILGLVAMVAVYSILQIATGTFGITLPR